jgi:hypothetical protein
MKPIYFWIVVISGVVTSGCDSLPAGIHGQIRAPQGVDVCSCVVHMQVLFDHFSVESTGRTTSVAVDGSFSFLEFHVRDTLRFKLRIECDGTESLERIFDLEVPGDPRKGIRKVEIGIIELERKRVTLPCFGGVWEYVKATPEAITFSSAGAASSQAFSTLWNGGSIESAANAAIKEIHDAHPWDAEAAQVAADMLQAFQNCLSRP